MPTISPEETERWQLFVPKCSRCGVGARVLRLNPCNCYVTRDGKYICWKCALKEGSRVGK